MLRVGLRHFRVLCFCAAFVIPASASAQRPSTMERLEQFSEAVAAENPSRAAALANRLWRADYSQLALDDAAELALRISIIDALNEIGAHEDALALINDLTSDRTLMRSLSVPDRVDLLGRHAEIARAAGRRDLARRLAQRARNGAETVNAGLGDPPPLTEGNGPSVGMAIDGDLEEALPPVESDVVISEFRMEDDRSANASTSDPFVVVPVYYGANREPSGSDDPNRYYGGRRGPLDVGVVNVSVPTQNREIGEIPRPSVWRGEFRPNPERHVILQDIQRFPGLPAMIRELNAQLEASDRGEVIVFIHGYNTEFRGAIERTAQLYVDLAVDGAAVAYSWPSRGGVLGYVADGGSLIRPVVNDLQTFLTAIAQASGAERVHVIAHSMGNRYLLEALEEIDDDGTFGEEPPFDELVFAAPDVDASDFAARAPGIRDLAGRMTLYASSNDRALAISRMIHGDYRRAGDANQPLVIDGVVQTVDTTASGGAGIGHDDFASSAMSDFRSVIWLSLEPEQRCVLAERDVEEGHYWAYGMGACDNQLFDAALRYIRLHGREGALSRIQTIIEAGVLPEVDWSGVRDIILAMPNAAAPG